MLRKLIIFSIAIVILAFMLPTKTLAVGNDCNNIDYIWGLLVSQTYDHITFEVHNSSVNCTTEVGVGSFVINTGDPFSSMDQTFSTGHTIQMGPGVQNLTVDIPRCNDGVGWQADAFFGPLDPGPELYGGRLLAGPRGQKYCYLPPTIACHGVPTGNSIFWQSNTEGGFNNQYSWTGPDGLSGIEDRVTQIYSTSGTKTASVTVTDSRGATDTAHCQAITSSLPPPPLPPPPESPTPSPTPTDAPTPTPGTSCPLTWGSTGSGNGQFSGVLGIAVDSSGNVYTTDVNSANRIQKFDASGTYITQWGSTGSGNSQFNGPAGIAVDSSGNVYVADNGNKRVQKFSSSGVFITQWGSAGTGSGQFDGPAGIAVDSSGNVYVADTGSNNRVEKFDSSGGFITQWGSTGSGNGQFNSPQGVAVDSSGNVYVTDVNHNRIQKFSSSGTYITQWGTPGTGNGQFNGAPSVAVDSSGNVYVADYGNYRIQMFDSSGTYLSQWGSKGSGTGQLNTPYGIAVDPSGNIYVSEILPNNRIQKFCPVSAPSPTPLPEPVICSFSGPVSVNMGEAGSFVSTSTGNITSRIWTATGGLPLSGVISGYNWAPSSPGTQTITLTVSGPGGQDACSASVTTPVPPTPTPTLSSTESPTPGPTSSPSPTVTASPSPETILCSFTVSPANGPYTVGQNLTFISTSKISTGAFASTAWSASGGSPLSGIASTFQWSAGSTGSVTITLNVNGAGLSDSCNSKIDISTKATSTPIPQGAPFVPVVPIYAPVTGRAR